MGAVELGRDLDRQAQQPPCRFEQAAFRRSAGNGGYNEDHETYGYRMPI